MVSRGGQAEQRDDAESDPNTERPSEWPKKNVKRVIPDVGGAIVRVFDKEDLIMRKWLRQKLPYYLAESRARVPSPLKQLWEELDKRMKHCSACTDRGTQASAKPRTLHDIEAAASHGCENCRLVLQVLRTFNSQFVQPGRSISSREIGYDCSASGLFGTDNTFELSILSSQTEISEKYCVSAVQTSPKLADATYMSVLSRRMLSIASHWLEECVSQHPQCGTVDDIFMPRRVICVGDQNRSPRLMESLPDGSLYAALSYCWGSINGTLVTKRHNIDSHFEKIPLEALPQTIQDAIIVCRCLDIAYLWVDALCIVQDDIAEQDWYEQSLQMGSIYTHAHLVICAAAASACIVGFLPKDDTRMIWKQVRHVPRKRKGAPQYRAACRREGDFRTHEGSMRSSALAQRGWATQECILPHRLLHFGEHEMIWECDSTCVCECGNTGLHDMWKHADFGLVNNCWARDVDGHASVHITDFLRGSSPGALCWVWERLIERYSQRTLTVPGDKLPAVSGLARLFQSTLKANDDEYLAGIWKSSLPDGLLWFVTGKPVSSRPKDWRAPSLSWASIDGGIGFFYERYQFTFKSRVRILECQCLPSSVDAFGRVRQGYIKVRGLLTPVKLRVITVPDDYDDPGQYAGCNGKAPRAYPDLHARVLPIGPWSWEVLLDTRMEAGEYVGDYYCLDIGRTRSLAGRGERCSWLVLRKCTNTLEQHGQRATLERIGVGMFDSSSMRGGPFVVGALVADIVLV